MDETWKTVSEFDQYEVSSEGRVRRSGQDNKVLSIYIFPSGYAQVNLFDNGLNHKRYVHHLVMQAFVGTPPAGMYVMHKNRIASDCRLENLKYATIQEINSRANQPSVKPKNASKKLDEDKVRAIRQRFETGGEKAEILAAEYGISTAFIYKIVRRQWWKHVTDEPPLTAG